MRDGELKKENHLRHLPVRQYGGIIAKSPFQTHHSARDQATTVEAEVFNRLVATLGGLRGSIETALPLVAFTVVYLTTDNITPSVVTALGSAAAAWGLRVARRSTTRFARNGLFGIAIAAAVAAFTGQAEAAFLPDIILNGTWVVALAVSILLRRPLAGYLIGAVLKKPTGWYRDPAVVRLGNRLTFVLLVPMVIRVAVQLPLYLAGEVGWLAVTRIALGWPLHAVTLAVAGAILLHGETPLQSSTRYRTGEDLQ
ncbi:MAG: DUF3159 domain-containing protein [Pseudohongiellaceae bacterium]